MNTDIRDNISDNFKMEIIYFVLNTSQKFAMHNLNVELQKFFHW